MTHLSLAQIRAALAYCRDHKEELDAVIKRRKREAYKILAQQPGHLSRAEFERRRKETAEKSV